MAKVCKFTSLLYSARQKKDFPHDGDRRVDKISMVPKMFKSLKFDCSFKLTKVHLVPTSKNDFACRRS